VDAVGLRLCPVLDPPVFVELPRLRPRINEIARLLRVFTANVSRTQNP